MFYKLMTTPLLRTALSLLVFTLIWWQFWYWTARHLTRKDVLGAALWYEGRYALPAALILFFYLTSKARFVSRLSVAGKVALATAVCLLLSPLWLLLVYLFALPSAL